MHYLILEHAVILLTTQGPVCDRFVSPFMASFSVRQFLIYIAQIHEWKEDGVYRMAATKQNPQFSEDRLDIVHLQLLPELI